MAEGPTATVGASDTGAAVKGSGEEGATANGGSRGGVWWLPVLGPTCEGWLHGVVTGSAGPARQGPGCGLVAYCWMVHRLTGMG